MNAVAYMQRAIELARLAGRATRSNPNVGAVVVHNDRIIGEGYHQAYGGPHAEVHAIASVSDQDQKLLPDSTLHVTLEPCNHHGKTPPCVDLIMKHGIRHVVIGTTDPNPQIAGQSVEKLRAAGVKVDVGVLYAAAQALIEPFVCHLEKRPYVILKQAVSTDGYIGRKDESLWLTGSLSKVVSHHWRDQVDGIIVGSNTVVTDDPSLTTRTVDGRDSTRIILDRTGRLPSTSRVFDQAAPTLVLTTPEVYKAYTNFVTISDWTLPTLLNVIYDQGIRYLLVEGGATLISSFVKEHLWDEALHFVAPRLLKDGIKAVHIEGKLLESHRLGPDHYMRFSRV